MPDLRTPGEILWDAIKDATIPLTGGARFKALLQPCRVQRYDGTRLVLDCQSDAVKQLIRTECTETLKAAAAQVEPGLLLHVTYQGARR